MNVFDDLASQIEKTKELIDMCKANHQAMGLPDFVSDLEISSLQQRLADLENQQREEARQLPLEEIEVKMYPQELPSGQISVRTLSTILGGLQSLTDSVANTLFNQPSNRGPIPQEILESNSWILKTIKAGSFIAVIDLKHEHQLAIDEIPQRQIITELFSLFNASDEEESLLDVISSLGTRTLRHYTEWTKNIRDLATPVELSWKSVQPEIGSVSFDSAKADRIFTILNEKLSYREEEISFEGRLTGVNVRTGSFELCSSEGVKLTGRILKDSVPKAVSYLDKRCKAELIKVITRSSAGKEKVSWILNDINFTD